MVYRFTIVSDEKEDFLREIQIDSDATFLELHKCILKSCDYTDDQMTSFFTCEHSWEKNKEITLEDMGMGAAIMGETVLSDMIEDEGERMLYCFDPMNDRYFYMELAEVTYGDTLKAPVCSTKQGEAPKQIADFDLSTLTASDLATDEEFFGSEGIDEEDFDLEDLNISEGNPFED